MNHWATILDSVEQGIAGDRDRCRAYAVLWREKLQQEGETRLAQKLQRVLQGERGQVIHLAEVEKPREKNNEETTSSACHW